MSETPSTWPFFCPRASLRLRGEPFAAGRDLLFFPRIVFSIRRHVSPTSPTPSGAPSSFHIEDPDRRFADSPLKGPFFPTGVLARRDGPFSRGGFPAALESEAQAGAFCGLPSMPPKKGGAFGLLTRDLLKDNPSPLDLRLSPDAACFELQTLPPWFHQALPFHSDSGHVRLNFFRRKSDSRPLKGLVIPPYRHLSELIVKARPLPHEASAHPP